jgi:hypothetical protein
MQPWGIGRAIAYTVVIEVVAFVLAGWVLWSWGWIR